MARRYALYTRHKDKGDECFGFGASYPTLEMALQQKRDNDRRFSNIESIIIESMNAHHRIDPYHIHFMDKKETVEA